MTQVPRHHGGLAGVPRSTLARGVAGVRWLAFWCAVALPVGYLLAFVPVGPVTLSVAELGALVVAHAVALLVGHGHAPAGLDGRPADRRSTAPDDRTTG